MVFNLFPLESAGVHRDTRDSPFYLAMVHAFPILTTMMEILLVKDASLSADHWYIHSLILCPCYMITNLICAKNLPQFIKANKAGGVYGHEMWNTHPFWTIVEFVTFALLQGGIYYALCSLCSKKK